MPKDLAKNMTSSKASWSGVSFSYVGDENKLSLFDIDLHIKSGETIGVIGGTGKSSLVQLIPRLYDATLEEVKVGGKNVKEYDLDSLRDSVAFVLQKNNLFSGTIKENLRWGNENATDEEIVEACRMAQADSFISAFHDGYDSYIEQGGKTSRGAVQRGGKTNSPKSYPPYKSGRGYGERDCQQYFNSKTLALPPYLTTFLTGLNPQLRQFSRLYLLSGATVATTPLNPLARAKSTSSFKSIFCKP